MPEDIYHVYAATCPDIRGNATHEVTFKCSSFFAVRACVRAHACAFMCVCTLHLFIYFFSQLYCPTGTSPM